MSLYGSKCEIITVGNALGWERAVENGSIVGSVRAVCRAPVEGDVSVPNGLGYERRILDRPPASLGWPLSPMGVLAAAIDERTPSETGSQILDLLRSKSHGIDLVVLESLSGWAESGQLTRLADSRSAGYALVNRLAVAVTHLGYELDVRWLDHAKHGSRISRRRFTALLRRDGAPKWPAETEADGWERAFREGDYTDKDWFVDASPTQRQIDILSRDWWREKLGGCLPTDPGQPHFLLHPSYTGSKDSWKVAPIRWGTQSAYPVSGKMLVHRSGSFYEMKRPAIEALCGFFAGDAVIRHLPDESAVSIVSQCTAPAVAANILWANITR